MAERVRGGAGAPHEVVEERPVVGAKRKREDSTDGPRRAAPAERGEQDTFERTPKRRRTETPPGYGELAARAVGQYMAPAAIAGASAIPAAGQFAATGTITGLTGGTFGLGLAAAAATYYGAKKAIDWFKSEEPVQMEDIPAPRPEPAPTVPPQQQAHASTIEKNKKLLKDWSEGKPSKREALANLKKGLGTLGIEIKSHAKAGEGQILKASLNEIGLATAGADRKQLQGLLDLINNARQIKGEIKDDEE